MLKDICAVTGERFRLYLNRDERLRKGVFAYPGDPEAAGFTRIFFTRQGLKIKHYDQPLGQVLKQQGRINDGELNSALETQEQLRKRRLGEILSEQHQFPQQTVEDAVTTARKAGQRTPQYRIGDILIEAGLVTRKQVEEAHARQEIDKGKRIGTILVEQA